MVSRRATPSGIVVFDKTVVIENHSVAILVQVRLASIPYRLQYPLCSIRFFADIPYRFRAALRYLAFCILYWQWADGAQNAPLPMTRLKKGFRIR